MTDNSAQYVKTLRFPRLRSVHKDTRICPGCLLTLQPFRSYAKRVEQPEGVDGRPKSPEQVEVQKQFLLNSSLIHGFIYSLYPSAEADDLLQEVFLVVTEKAEEFRPGTDFLAWVRKVARYKVLEHCGLRTRRRVVVRGYHPSPG